MTAAHWFFWISFFFVAYTYLLYPIILFFAYAFVQLRRDLRYLTGRGNRRSHELVAEDLPAVTFVVPVYNEESNLAAKIQNLRGMDYPAEKLQAIFVSDASTDRTNEILGGLQDPHFERFLRRERSGKAGVLNFAVERARHEILVFSDGSTLFAPDAVRKLVRHFQDPTVGAVCGALGFFSSPESQQTEGVYWKYESMLRLMEARLGATLTASGAIYALRRSAYAPLPPNTVLDDFVTSMNVRKAGYRVLYDPEAMASDFAPESVSGEFARRVRLAVGSFRALGPLAHTPMDGFTRFAFFSHKVLRWVVPVLLILLVLSNLVLASQRFYFTFLLLQLTFYLWAAAGYFFREQLRQIRFARAGYFLFAMNLAFLVGLVRIFTSRKEATWQRVS